jgi:anti-sigma regulatory factor (Ser/Thr protein kinase)
MTQHVRQLVASSTVAGEHRRDASPPSFAARWFTRETLERWQVANVRDDVLSIVGELVANAVMHAAGSVTLILRLREHDIHVEVLDDSPTLPNPHTTSADGTSGRGLAIISSLSNRWGARPRANGGKSVWADIDLSGEHARLDDAARVPSSA